MRRINYEKGEKIGKFIFLRDAGSAKGGRQAVFECHCGKEFINLIGAVKIGSIAGCRDCNMILPGRNVNGTYFIEERGHKGKRRVGLFECKYCKKHFESLVENVSSGNTTSCGCYQKRIRGKANITHGYSRCRTKSVEYKTWLSIKERCNRVNNPCYPDYGGRGIKVCDRWDNNENGFLNFLNDMGNRPSKNHTIERNKVNGDYEPNNCCWLLKADQSKNRRNTIWIEINGVKLCLSDWCRKVGIKRGGVSERIRKSNKNDATKIFLEFISEKGIKFFSFFVIYIFSIFII